MKYCRKCLLPDTKPDLTFDDTGLCSACSAYDARPTIDWDSRKKELITILDKYKGNHYDCIVPVSGGKDSTYQVITMLELGYKPLCITATTCDLSAIGRNNIENIKRLGVDLIEFSISKPLRAKLNKIGLETIGDISWPEHVAIFTIPVRAAVAYKVPLIIWGENSQNEYGGPAENAESPFLTRRWLEEFGGLNGLRVSDMIGTDGITEKDLWALTYPTQEELDDFNITGIFLGHYIPWDGYENAIISVKNGFQVYDKWVEGSCVDYENLDNYQTGIHDYFKFLKFGYGRTTDLVSMAIRRGKIPREEGIVYVKNRDGMFPESYLGKGLNAILNNIGMTRDEFMTVVNKFKVIHAGFQDFNNTACK
jgi:N-acetyl sugar amidotransferase